MRLTASYVLFFFHTKQKTSFVFQISISPDTSVLHVGLDHVDFSSGADLGGKAWQTPSKNKRGERKRKGKKRKGKEKERHKKKLSRHNLFFVLI